MGKNDTLVISGKKYIVEIFNDAIRCYDVDGNFIREILKKDLIINESSSKDN